MKSLWSKNFTHEIWVKSETKIFFVSKGGPFGAFPIFKVSISRHWSSLKDIIGGTHSFECWNIDVDRCQNVQNSNWNKFECYIGHLQACKAKNKLWVILTQSHETTSFQKVMGNRVKFRILGVIQVLKGSFEFCYSSSVFKPNFKLIKLKNLEILDSLLQRRTTLLTLATGPRFWPEVAILELLTVLAEKFQNFG